jgi:hypothetical protein
MAPVALAVVLLAGCGGGGDDDSASGGAPAVTDAGSSATDAPKADSGSGGGGGGGGLFGGAAAFAKNLKFALGADSAEAVDDVTVDVTFSDGSVADADSKCSIAKMSVSTDIHVHLIYPDGETDC